MKNDKTTLNENLIDAAASEALGANTQTDSATYQQEVAAAGEDARRLDRQFHETVARMAAASPYMKPPADLRGRLLQATAPTTFRMEDYRKATGDSGRLYRWGFYAALAFLAAGAWFNINMRNTVATAQGQVAVLTQQIQLRDTALNDLISPKADEIALMQNKKVAGKAFVNDETKSVVMVLPEGILPTGKTISKMTLNRNNKTVTYNAIAVTTPREAFPQWTGEQLNNEVSVDNVAPDPQQKVYTANMAH